MTRPVAILCPRCRCPALLEILLPEILNLPIVTCECGPAEGLDVVDQELPALDLARARKAARP